MKLGIFAKTYPIRDVAALFEKMAADGLTTTQFNLSCVGLPTVPAEPAPDEKLEQVAGCVRASGVSICALSGTFNMIDPDPELRRGNTARFRNVCRAAADLGIPMVTLCTGSRNPESQWKWHPDNVTESAWTDLLRTTEQLLTDAQRWGVTLGVETEDSNIICTAEKARRYLDVFADDHLKIIMDGANLLHAGQQAEQRLVLTEAFRLLSGDIALAHAKDLAPTEEISFLAAGTGILDYDYYMSLLKAAGYSGPLILHSLAPEQVPQSVAFLRGLLAE